MNFDDYKALDAVNWSTLRHMDTSPAHYRAAITTPRPSTPAQDIGTALHTAVLEPDTFESRVAVWEGGRRYGKTWDAFRDEHAGKLILKADEVDDVLAAATSTRSHPAAAALLAKGRAEVTLQWTDAVTGIDCKGRADWLHVTDDAVTLVDLKKSRDISPRGFSRACVQYSYHGQLGFYASGLRRLYPGRAVSVYIIAVEATAPYDVLVYDMGEALPHGEAMAGRLLDALAEARRLDEWPGRCGRAVVLDLPPWGHEGRRGAA